MDDEKPPVLSREAPTEATRLTFHTEDEENDYYVEMEEDEEEDEDVLEMNHPAVERPEAFREQHEAEPTDSFANHSQETEAELDILETYNGHSGSKNRPKYTFDHSKYIIEYRPSQYKSKNKASHNVAIVAKVDANICHEFSYNRTSDFDGTKYYTCLGCRKAKAETRIKDVIRTIRIEERYRSIVSRGDPFGGHHYACQPLPWAPDTRSYGHVLPQPMHMDLGVYPSELVFVDGDTAESIWEPESSYLANIPFYGEAGPPPRTEEEETKPFVQKRYSSGNVKPFTDLDVTVSNPPPPSLYKRFKNKRKMAGKRIPPCHLCFAVLPSTEALIAHLQIHIQRAPKCEQCGSRIPIDSLRLRRGGPNLCLIHQK